MRRFALGMAHAYAAYVVINMAIFHMNDPDTSTGHVLGSVVSVAIADRRRGRRGHRPDPPQSRAALSRPPMPAGGAPQASVVSLVRP